MNEALLTGLQKKDTDLQVLENTPDNLIVLTSLNIGEEIVEELPPIFPPISVPIEIVRQLFVSHALITFLIPILGIVPFYLLIMSPFIVSTTLIFSSGGFLVLLYIVMYLLRESTWGLPTYLIWMFNNYIVLVALSGIISSFAPFQGCSILFIESISIILLGFLFKKEIDPLWAILIMMIAGLIIWGVGLYAFIKEQDWISSMILFLVCIMGYPIASGYMIYKINNGKFHGKETMRLLISFWTG